MKFHRVFAFAALIVFLVAAAPLAIQADPYGRTGGRHYEAPTYVGACSPYANDLVVGAAQTDISPTTSQVLGGYGMYVGSRTNCRWSQGVHDPLFATALFFMKGDSALVLIELDLVGFVAADVNEVRRRVAEQLAISPDRVIVAASHTHHSPDTVGLWGTIIPAFSGRDEAYIQLVIDRSVEAAKQAFDAKRPANISMAVGQEERLHFNTYEDQIPDAPIDHTVTVVKITDVDGRTVATLTNWGCHPTTENGENKLISSDWVGTFRQELAQRHQGIHMFVNGSVGAAIQPSVPWRDRTLKSEGQGFLWAQAMGKAFAKKVDSLLVKAKPVEVPEILVRSVPVTIRMKNIAFWLARSSGQVKLGLPTYGAPYTTHVVAAQIGDLRLGTMPGEMSPQIGMRLRESLGGRGQVLVGLGQDWLGYIIDPQQYKDRRYAYEKLLCLNPHLGDEIVKAYRAIDFQ